VGPASPASGAPSGVPDARKHAFCLLAIGEDQFTSHWLAEGDQVVLGRSPDCDVLLPDASVALRHARLTVGPELLIEDLGSEHGTQLRGGRLAPNVPTPFSPWDLVLVGQVSLVLQQRPSGPTRRLHAHDYFEARLEEECIRAERYASRFGVLRVHVEGDRTQVEDALASTLRVVDVFAVYAPGEYELLLPNTPREGLKTVVERIERVLSRIGAAVRVGGAAFPEDGKNAHALLAAARKKLEPELPVELPAERAPEHSPMAQLDSLVRRIAHSNISVLVLGETGVGKERLAEKLHLGSPRAKGPFVRLNCAALTESLLESELFGHERGSFTGAIQSKPGLLETAEGGTLFLDEVGDLPLSMQVKLLRVLEERQVLRVGGLKPRAIDVRFVSATNKDLEREVAAGRYREDLYFRLNGVTLMLPPLRERLDEIEPLARGFITSAYRSMGKTGEVSISAEALEIMKQYPWPGNVRELRNVIERAMLLCSGGVIAPTHLPLEKMLARFAGKKPSPLVAPPPRPASEEGDERHRIEEALQLSGGNQTEAARILGISRRTLINRLEEYGISGPRKKRSGAEH
jgi:two-component system response regulator AtoC